MTEERTRRGGDAMEEPTRTVPAGPGTPRPGGDGSAGGFTVAEMLVALVIAGVLAAGVITLLMGQNRFYGATDDVVYAEQSLRATSDMLASEIRGIAPRGDVVAAGARTLTFRMDLHRGVVCHVDGASRDVYVFMYSETTAPNTGDPTGVAFREAYDGSAFAYQAFDPLVLRRVAADPGSVVATTCENNGGPPVAANEIGRYWLIPSWPGSPVPRDGSVLRIFGEVTYEFGASSFTPGGTAIFRNSQEVASPFGPDASFSYVMAGGGVRSSVPAGETGDIVRVRIGATAVGDGGDRYGVSRGLRYDVPLRNRG